MELRDGPSAYSDCGLWDGASEQSVLVTVMMADTTADLITKTMEGGKIGMKKNMKWWKTAVTAAVLVLLIGVLAACGSDGGGGSVGPADGNESQEPADGSTTPGGTEAGDQTENPSFSNFKALDLDGNDVDQTVFADYDLTMVNVWGTFCSYCLQEMPDLGEINKEYADKSFQVVGVVTDVLNQDMTVSTEQLELAREIVDKTKADYLHLVPTEDLLYAGIGSIRTLPTTFFLDKDGNFVGDVYSGAKSKSKWEDIIDKTLEEVQE